MSQSDNTKQAVASADLNNLPTQAPAEGTTTSGDTKGESTSIGAEDVGSLSDLLGGVLQAGEADGNGAEGEGKIEEAPKGDASAVTLSPRTPVNNVEGAIDATLARAPAPAAAPAAAPLRDIRAGVTVQTTKAEAEGENTALAAAYKVVSMQVSAALVQLEEYVRDMAPAKPQTAKSIEQNQVKFLNSLTIILASDETSFRPAYLALLSLVRANRDKAFKITLRHRGLNSVALGVIDNRSMRILTRMIDLLVVTAGVNDIGMVKQHVDIKKVFEAVTNVRAQQNLTAFYSA